MQDPSTKFQGYCTRFEVVSWFDKNRDPRETGEGVPTDLRGELTESQLRKSKNLAKRRRQTNFTKFKAKKGSENRQNPAKATFGKKPLRERHFAKTCANDEDGSNTAPIPLILAKAYSELPFSMLNFLFKIAENIANFFLPNLSTFR